MEKLKEEYEARIEEIAGEMYETYRKWVGSIAVNGTEMPPWHEFATDPKRWMQADGYRAQARMLTQQDSWPQYVADTSKIKNGEQPKTVVSTKYAELAKEVVLLKLEWGQQP